MSFFDHYGTWIPLWALGFFSHWQIGRGINREQDRGKVSLRYSLLLMPGLRGS